MREVMDCYGKFILDSMVVLVIVMLLFVSMTDENGNRGLYSIIGAQMDFHHVDYCAYTDFKEVYRTESQKATPRIYFEGHGLEVGTHRLWDYIKAVDETGKELHVKIKGIIAPDNVDLLEMYNPVTSEIYLSQTGVYRITVFAINDNNKFTEAVIQIPINHRKGNV